MIALREAFCFAMVKWPPETAAIFFIRPPETPAVSQMWSCPPQMRKAAAGDRGGFFIRRSARWYNCTGINAVFVGMHCLGLIHVAARIAALAGARL
jgi:hypothetical protein